jgi:beta-phosphoglucomutase-like phosphatase (HAD superfamily)
MGKYREPDRKVAIFDIDGVLSDITHRLHLINGENPPDWDTFYSLAYKDPPIPQGLWFLKQCVNAGYHCALFTGRRESIRSSTHGWLITQGATYHSLYMRADGDHIPAPELKLEWYDQMVSYGLEVLFAVEDNPATVEAYRKAGVFVFATNPDLYKKPCGALDEDTTTY